MKTPKYTDLHRRQGRYRTADETHQPGYLAKRLKAYARLQRMRSKVVATIQPKARKA